MNRVQGTQLITRACSLLRQFNRQQVELSLSDLAKQSDLHLTTTYRISQALVQEGLLAQDPASGKYRLGLGLLKLGELARQSVDWMRIAYPRAQALAVQWGETTIVDTLDRDLRVISVLFFPSSYRLAANPDYNKPIFAHCVAAGKVLLANLPTHLIEEYLSHELTANTEQSITDSQKLRQAFKEIRKSGYATNLEEEELGFGAIAAPIRDWNGQVIAAISLGGPITRLSPDRFPELIPSIMDAAREISCDLGYDENSYNGNASD